MRQLQLVAPRAALAARGIVAVMANSRSSPEAVLAGLNEAFTDFKTRNDERLTTLEASIDGLHRRNAADLFGGGVSAGPERRKALAAFGEFSRSGSAAAMRELSPQAAMHGESDPDGGFLIPEEVGLEILSVQRRLSPMRRLARVVPTKSSEYKQPITTEGVAAGWVGERGARPETEASKLSLLSFPAGEIYAMPAVTQTLLDDSAVQIATYVIGEIGKSFDEKEGDAFINGDGMNKSRGVLTYATYNGASNAVFGKLEVIHSGHATLLNNPDKLIDTLHALKAGHRNGATWLMNSTTQAVVAKLKDLQGQYLWQRALAVGVPDTLLGLPVELDENMPDIAANSLPIALGNWKDGYLINDRLGIRVLRDPYSAKPYILFYSTKRVGGGLLDSNAIKLVKIAV